MAITKKKPKRTEVEDLLAQQLRENDLTAFRRDVPFIEGRKFRADFYFEHLRLCVEVDGGVWMPKGGHTTGGGYTSDRIRDHLARSQGIDTLRFTSEQVRNKHAITFLTLYVPHREKEVNALSCDPATSTGFANQLPAGFGT